MGEAGSAAAFQVAADGRAAVALPEAGDELMIELTKADYEAVSAAIREAEKRTSGQIVCVLAHSSSGMPMSRSYGNWRSPPLGP
jgi:uncharacterized membrane protein